ncbi:MAG TPA: hypothetical protein VGB98_26985, partial [Pyrinomonadaceae bacterium]
MLEEGLVLEELARAGAQYEPRARAFAFARRHGSAHAALALYASLPLGLTPDLVHLLRVNFVPSAPWIAEADLLLSPLCREAGGEFYEMDARVREFLLDEFAADVKFGVARLRRAAEFLYVYAGRARVAARRRDARAFWQAQEWTALAYARPEEAARALASELGRKIEEADAGEALRVARVAHTLASPLGAHDELVLYAAGFERMMSGGDGEEAFELFDAAGSNAAALSVAGVSLPSTPELAVRLGLQTPRAAAPDTQAQTQAQAQTDPQYPPGLTLSRTFSTGEGYVTHLAWSPSGKSLAAPTTYSSIYIWDEGAGVTHTLQAHPGGVPQVTWSPDGKQLAAITDGYLSIWKNVLQAVRAPELYEVPGALVRRVAWSPDGKRLVTVDASSILMFSPDGRLQLTHEEKVVSFVTWLPSGDAVAFATESGNVGLYMPTWTGHIDRVSWRAGVSSLAAAPDGLLLAAGARDGVISVLNVVPETYNPPTLQLAATLEGHAGAVTSLSFSADGSMLASKSLDGTVRLWNTQTRETIAVLDEPVPETSQDSGVAFHPQRPDTLATLDGTGRGVRVWSLNPDLLLRRAPKEGEVYYKNANVLLIGNNESGKTYLAARLMEYGAQPGERTQRTPSQEHPQRMPPATQGVSVGQLYKESISAPDGRTEVREVTLRESAGEWMTRPYEELGLTEVSLALFVFDPSRGETFNDITRWREELRRAQSERGTSVAPKSFLVETHADIERESDVAGEIESLRRMTGFDGTFRTSALTGQGVGQLLSAIREAIDWDALPAVVTTKLFESAKAFVGD